MNTSKRVIIMMVFISFFGLISCSKEVISLKNETDSRLENIQVKIERGGRLIFSKERLMKSEVVEFNVKISTNETGDGRFIMEFEMGNSGEKKIRYFGYYNGGSINCTKQIIRIKNNRLIEDCQ